MPLLSIIIVSWNTREVTRNCLASIRDAQLGIEFEVILVDNASEDGTPAMVETEFPSVRLLANERNERFARGNNLGVELASGELLLLLNSDTVVPPGALESLVAFFQQGGERMGCVGPRVLNVDGSLQSEGRPLLFGTRGALLRHLKIHRWGRFLPGHRSMLPPGLVRDGRIRRVGFVAGCCMLLRRDVYERVDGFDEDRYFFYGEEIGLCRKLADAGLETWVYPEATIVHLGGASTTSEMYQQASAKSLDAWIERGDASDNRLAKIAETMVNVGGYFGWSILYRLLGHRGSAADNTALLSQELVRLRRLAKPLEPQRR